VGSMHQIYGHTSRQLGFQDGNKGTGPLLIVLQSIILQPNPNIIFISLLWCVFHFLLPTRKTEEGVRLPSCYCNVTVSFNSLSLHLYNTSPSDWTFNERILLPTILVHLGYHSVRGIVSITPLFNNPLPLIFYLMIVLFPC